jgi:hypothetical protein
MTVIDQIKDKLHIGSSSSKAITGERQPTMAPNLPKSYKAIVIEGPNAGFKIKEIPLEMPQRGQILIKVHVCGVCHSDTFLEKGLFGPLYAAWISDKRVVEC